MTNRQKKINALLQQDFAEILHLLLHRHNLKKQVVSVTAVRVTPDLQIAKVYLSIFPFSEAKRIRNQLRVVPDLLFFIDDSLQQIEKIDQSLHNPENPLKS